MSLKALLQIIFPGLFPRHIAGISAGTAAALAAGVATAAGSLASGAMQSSAAGKAADAQQQSQALQIAQKDAALHSAQSYLSPYATSGAGAQGKLDYLLGTNAPISAPNSKSFYYTDTLGTQRFDQAGFDQANKNFAAQAAQFGYTQPSAPDKRAFYVRRGNKFVFDKKAFNAANIAYTQQKADFYKQIRSPEALAKMQGQQAQQAGGERGSLLHEFNAQDYQNDPTYTPFVNTLEDLQKTPGYQFRLQQGEQSLNRQAAANGGLLSGAAMKAMNRYGQDYASNEYQSAWDRAQTAFGNAFNRYNQNRTQKYNMLAGQGQQGMQAASGMAGNAMNSGAQGVQIASTTGDALSSIKLAQGNAWGNAIQGAANSIAGGVAGYGGGGWGNMTASQAGINGPMPLTSKTG